MSTPTPPKQPVKGTQNPAFRMLGLPNLPRKLPSRNWTIFLSITGAVTAAVIYDKREKNRATAKWRKAVAPLAEELLAAPNQLPRKLTIYLESPPGDGLRVAQDHFIEYVKPVLSSSGLDWEFVQGRQQGDVRAAVAEKIRRSRRVFERPDDEIEMTDEARVEKVRERNRIPKYEGVNGDIIIGRHTWKEYVRGLHEGWLGSLDAPIPPQIEAKPATTEDTAADGEKKEEEAKVAAPDRPPQPPPYNSPNDYDSASIPIEIPVEFSPSTPIPLPHRLGFSHTFVRIGRFLNRRKLADNIGREVAAVCFAASREWREADGQTEQQLVLQHEENDWPKSVWEPDEVVSDKDAADKTPDPPKEKIWISPLVIDRRVTQRMRRFEITPEDEARAARIVVPEEEIEGWIKGSFRSLWRWGASSFDDKHKGPNVGNVDDE